MSDRDTRYGHVNEPLDVEWMLRREWWLHHGHPYPALYGDDGEMQCAACPMDFKREPIASLHFHVLAQRAKELVT